MGLFKKKVLVTGAFGFVGKHLVKRLKSLNYNVIKVTRENFKDIDKLIKRVNIVFHLGTNIGFTNYKYNKNKLKQDCQTLGYLLKLCELNLVKKFIFLSSNLVKNDFPNLYIQSKQISEFTIKHISKIEYVILRMPGIYGPGQRKTGTIYKLTKKSLAQNISKDIKDIYKNYIYIDEAIDILIKSMNKKNVTYNIIGTTNLTEGIKKYTESLRKTIYFDFDGTITDLRGKKPYKKPFKECLEVFKDDKLVPGTKNILKKLKKCGYRLILISKRTKKSLFIYEIKKLGIDHLFKEFINTRQLEKYHFIKYPNNSIFVGDTEDDILTGKHFNMKTIAVLSGRRNMVQLKQLKPDFILNNINEIFSKKGILE